MNSTKCTRNFGQLFIIVLACCQGWSPVYANDTLERTNFVIIIGDDVGWNDIGTYGNPYVRTPNVDALAKAGLKFENAFLTTSSCSPSRASIMAGRYPHSTGAGELHQPLSGDVVTMASLLKGAGYYTACAGKFHMGNIQGHFDSITTSKPSGCETWVDVLKERPKEKPFFLWLAGFDAHRSWSATQGKHAIDAPHTNDEVVLPPYVPDTLDVRRDFAEYYDEVSRLDDYTGRVVAELKRQGVLENTLIIFMSDNGRPFPRAKTTLYDDGLKTPFIVQWSGTVGPGKTTEGLMSSVDIAPTITEIAGLQSSPTFQGRSFASILLQPELELRDHVIGEHNWHDYQAHERSVRTKKYLYVRNAFPGLPGTPPADAVRSPTYREILRLRAEGNLPEAARGLFLTPRAREAVFDLENDPYAFENRIDDPDMGVELNLLRSYYERWVRETNDAVPEVPTPDKFHRETGERLAR